MPKGIFLLDTSSYEKIYPLEIRRGIEDLVHIIAPQQTKASIANHLSLLEEVDVLFSGWGAAVMDEHFLQAAPNLKAVFYGAGSIKGTFTEAFWRRNILITSSYAANAIPVAEYTLSQILFALKRGWYLAQWIKKEGKYPNDKEREELYGAYGSTVGIISLGMIGRRVCQLLSHFEVKVIAYDPFISETDAAKLNVELGSLEEVFRRAEVVSLHAPWLKETEGMIKGTHFASMKRGAAFINTSRGAIVREQEMIEILQERSDLQAILDVTCPEPPIPGSPLYTLPNVVLTPHIAGAVNQECGRMGSYMVDELRRYIQGEPLLWAISQQRAESLA